MIATPIIAVSAMPSAATATPVRLSEPAMSRQASRATGPSRTESLAAASARALSAAGVTAATPRSSMKSVAKPARRLRPETQTSKPAPAASEALTTSSDRARCSARLSSTERESPSCGALAATSSAGSSAAASAVNTPPPAAATSETAGTLISLTATTK